MDKHRKIFTILALSFLLVFSIITALHTKPLFWDEAYYIYNLTVLDKYGFSNEFLLHLWGPAGPTFTWLHFILRPITNLQTPSIRFVNVILLVATIYLLYLCFKRIAINKQHTFNKSLTVLSIPTVYTISGLVLTEMPAIFCATIAIYFITIYYEENRFTIVGLVITAISISLSILARQPFLMLLLAIPALFISPKFLFNFSKTQFNKFIFICFVFALIIPGYVFYVWKNIQPPTQVFTGNGLAPQHLILALGYAGVHAFFINPHFFIDKKILQNFKEFGIISLAGIMLNIFIFKINFTPFLAVVLNNLSAEKLNIYNLISGSILTAAAFCFVFIFIKKTLQLDNQLMLFFAIAFLLIICTSIKVTHQFSARYVVQAFPLLVLTLNYKREKFNILSITTLILGALLGLASLQFYFTY